MDALSGCDRRSPSWPRERLTGRESLLALRRDWRKRKKSLDAVAAAIILQDYLDR